MVGSVENSLLFSLFSVRHRALPDLQGMKVGNSAPSNGMWQPTFLLGNRRRPPIAGRA